jgi:hypothetical protein|uniref:Uncharacterized protein n=1 Tax=Schlesneria paludicola TaxID=360056 RepID=A0A7C4LKR0_9PLAN
MTTSTSPRHTLAAQILDRIDQIVRQAHAETRPLEVEPYRSQLFELFVAADGAGATRAGADPDLTADGLCRALGERWGLAAAARGAFAEQTPLPPASMSQMRLLWSLLRMWMEWTYAWERWEEFHRAAEE